MMQVGGENQRNTHQAQKIANEKPLLVLRGIDSRDETQTQLLGNDGTGNLQR